MGACVSRPENCVGGKFGGSRKKKKGRKTRRPLKRRLHSHQSNRLWDRVENFPSLPCLPFVPSSIPLFKIWMQHGLNSAAVFESAWSDEDVLSLRHFDVASTTSFVPQSDTSHAAVCKPVSDAARNLISTCASNIKVRNVGLMSVVQPWLDEIPGSSRETCRKEENLLDNCVILPNNCLPCLASTVSPIERRRSLSSSPSSARFFEAPSIATSLFSSKALVQRGIAGSQVPFCSENKIRESWSDIEPENFKG